MKIKNFLLCVILLVTGIVGINQSYANDFSSHSDAEKMYVLPEEVEITSEGIFVLFEGEKMPVQAIIEDDQGIYYLFPPKFTWTCGNCKEKNAPWRVLCWNCGKHY